MLYIHQYPSWTSFRYDTQKIINALGDVRLQEGKLIGIMETCGFKKLEQEILITDIVANYAIDGYSLNKNKILTQIKKLNSSENSMVQNYMGAIINAFKPITHKRLYAWHASMGQNRIPNYRQKNSSVDYNHNNYALKFEGPSEERINQEMDHFIEWIENSQIDGVIKAAIAHFWFITLRPFSDANGRMARIITILMLARTEQTTRCQFSLNQAILENRESYFDILNKTQKGNGDLTEWILWFIEMLKIAMDKSQKDISDKLKRMAFYNRYADEIFSKHEQKIISAIFDKELPESFSAVDVANLLNSSHDTAIRAIHKLMGKHILKSNTQRGRGQRYFMS